MGKGKNRPTRTIECHQCGKPFLSCENGPLYCSVPCRRKRLRDTARCTNAPSNASPIHVAEWPSARIVIAMSQLPETERRRACLGHPEFARTEGLRRGWVSKDDVATSQEYAA